MSPYHEVALFGGPADGKYVTVDRTAHTYDVPIARTPTPTRLDESRPYPDPILVARYERVSLGVFSYVGYRSR